MSDKKVYAVEALLKKCKHKGENFYLVKWEGYPTSQNTWEPESNLTGCQNLIAALDYSCHISGFRDGYEPIEVTGAGVDNGKTVLLIKWHNDTSSFVYAEEANQRCPQLVIAFYENNLRITKP